MQQVGSRVAIQWKHIDTSPPNDHPQGQPNSPLLPWLPSVQILVTRHLVGDETQIFQEGRKCDNRQCQQGSLNPETAVWGIPVGRRLGQSSENLCVE
jgi:hypothetical protein